MNLGELQAGEHGTILAVHGAGALRRRLMDMGLTPGTSVLVRKVAPLGDPMELCVRGYTLSMRKADAEIIAVEKITGCACCPHGQQPFGRHGFRWHRQRGGRP